MHIALLFAQCLVKCRIILDLIYVVFFCKKLFSVLELITLCMVTTQQLFTAVSGLP
jgi:hypothetical protein